MRKSLFLTLVLSLCVADFGAFAAAQRRGTGTTTPTNTATQAAPVSARAGARQKVVSAPTKTSSASAPVSARAGARQKVASVPTTTAKTSSGTGNVAARSATKKALSMGTKVATATENTVVSQECQNAYYGCMDAFCMLDNAAGGRCQCNDRNAELDAVLDEIMRIDEQSARIATEGVEQIQMGEYADQINNRAKSVESGIASSKSGASASASASKKSSSSSTTRSLDLSIFSTNNLFDAEEDEGVFTEVTEASVLDDIAGKTGDDLQKAAAKVCVAQVPAQCKSSLSMLQMAYVQKVKSDCVGYENALKQQRSASQQKLLTAQKAIRDAALDEVRKQNKYETAGECAIAFAQCMQTTAECGSDYTGCVTLAAANNLKASINDDNNNKQAKKPNGNNNDNKGGISNKTAASYTIKGVVSGADITIAASTMEALLAKKEICASVTKQCVNANKNDAVWNVFLRNAAPALKSAEVIAEQNLRSNCIPTVAECFKTACKSQFGDNNDNYDMCLSNPDTYKSLCKVQLEPCLNATGGTYENPTDSTLWTGLVAMLNSMKVDACTKEVKDCLLSEDRCGKDYSGCIGLDTKSIVDLCPVEKLTACVTDGRFAKRTSKTRKDDNDNDVFDSFTVENEDEIRNYVAQIAQGLALNIDNSFATVCQNAAEAALVKACGDGGSDEEGAMCPNLDLDFASLKNKMRIAYKIGDKTYDSIDAWIADNSDFSMKKLLEVKPVIENKIDVYNIKYNTDDASFEYANSDESDDLLSEINTKYALLFKQIKSDPTVVYCMEGRQIEGFDGNKFGKQALRDGQGGLKRDNDGNLMYGKGRFPKLLNATGQQLASQIMNSILKTYNTEYANASEKLNVEYENLVKRVADYVTDVELDVSNEAACKANGGVYISCDIGLASDTCHARRTFYEPEYKKDTNQCIIHRRMYYCPWMGWHHYVTDEPYLRVHCISQGDPGPKYIQLPSVR